MSMRPATRSAAIETTRSPITRSNTIWFSKMSTSPSRNAGSNGFADGVRRVIAVGAGGERPILSRNGRPASRSGPARTHAHAVADLVVRVVDELLADRQPRPDLGHEARALADLDGPQRHASAVDDEHGPPVA